MKCNAAELALDARSDGGAIEDLWIAKKIGVRRCREACIRGINSRVGFVWGQRPAWKKVLSES